MTGCWATVPTARCATASEPSAVSSMSPCFSKDWSSASRRRPLFSVTVPRFAQLTEGARSRFASWPAMRAISSWARGGSTPEGRFRPNSCVPNRRGIKQPGRGVGGLQAKRRLIPQARGLQFRQRQSETRPSPAEPQRGNPQLHQPQRSQRHNISGTRFAIQSRHLSEHIADSQQRHHHLLAIGGERTLARPSQSRKRDSPQSCSITIS